MARYFQLVFLADHGQVLFAHGDTRCAHHTYSTRSGKEARVVDGSAMCVYCIYLNVVCVERANFRVVEKYERMGACAVVKKAVWQFQSEICRGMSFVLIITTDARQKN